MVDRLLAVENARAGRQISKHLPGAADQTAVLTSPHPVAPIELAHIGHSVHRALRFIGTVAEFSLITFGVAEIAGSRVARSA